MDKIEKALKKLSDNERKKIKSILQKINDGKFEGLDIKKLKGRSDIFRVRNGDIRIIYREYKTKIFILTISRRSEKTYNA